MIVRLAWLAALCAACTDGTKTDDPETAHTADTDPTDTGLPLDTGEPEGACGDVTTWNVVLTGTVEDAVGNPLVGAEITLEDRGWMPTTVLATDISDGYGAFALDVVGLTSVENCWGTLLDYVVIGSTSEGRVGEDDVNPSLFDAVYVGPLSASMPVPLVLAYPEN